MIEQDETPEQVLARSDLTLLTLLRDQVQRLRIAEGNRAAAAEKLGEVQRKDLHSDYRAKLADLESEITRSLKPEVEAHPAWAWLGQIRGVSHTTAALVVGQIDINRCDTVSSLWRFSGYGVVNGKRERLVKGEKAHFNRRLKRAVYLVVDSQVKSRGPYRKAYDDAKNRYLTTRGPDSGFQDENGKPWTLGHCENAARGYAGKLFLSHLWRVWREAEGLPTPDLWIEQYGGTNHDIIDPWEYTQPLK